MVPSHATPLPPQLAQFVAAMQRHQQTIDALAQPLTADQFGWQPAPGTWSVAEILDHLTTIHTAMLPPLEEARLTAERKGWHSDAPFRYGFFGALFIRSNEPTAPATTTPPAYVPPARAGRDQATVLREFTQAQTALLTYAAHAAGLDIGRVKAASAAFAPLRLSVFEWLAVFEAHERLHIAQIEQTITHPAFPAA